MGVLAASVQYDALEDVGDVDPKTYPNYPSLMLDLDAGRIDAGLVDPPSLAYRLEQEPDLDIEFVDEFEAGEKFYVGLAAPKDSMELIEQVNAVLDEMKSDGSLVEIMEKWGIADRVDVPQS